MAKKRKKKKGLRLTWDKLPAEKRDLYVTLLWKEGYTERAIADFLHTTKGRVVVHRQRTLKLSSTGRMLKRSTKITFENLRDLFDIDEMDEQAQEGIVQTSDIFQHDVPENEASAEAIRHAVEEGKVTELSPAEKSAMPKTEDVDIPSTTDLPFLPPPDTPEQPAGTEESEDESEGFIAQEAAGSRRKCQWRKGGACENEAKPGSIYCREHLKMLPPGPFGRWRKG